MSEGNASMTHPCPGKTSPHRTRKKILYLLSCLVVFCTVYALILPAITVDLKCGMEEHTHTRECYRQVTAKEDLKLTCSPESLNIHKHSPACYDTAGNLVCGYADYVIHTHSKNCYDPHGNLVCPLPEMKEHIHTESCYTQSGDSDPVLTCALPLIQVHVHNATCYDADGNLTCGNLETYEHTHSSHCFTAVKPSLTCTIPEGEGHTHTELCYGKWELICELPEHTHTEACYKAQDPASEQTEAGTAPQDLPAEPQATTKPSASAEPTESPDVDKPTSTEEPMETPMQEEPETLASDPIDVSSYIRTAKLKYKRPTDHDWQPIEGATIPGDAHLRLEATYDMVPIDELLAHNRQLTYTLPDLLRNPVAEGEILDDQKNAIGTVAVSGNVLTMTFYEDWLQGLFANDSTEVSGAFNVESTVNISLIPDGGKHDIVIGNMTLSPSFEDDLLTKYGNVDVAKAVSKKVIRENGQDYLEYTLTLTAGMDGCTDVKVVDSFRAGQNVVAYDNLSSTSTTLTNAGYPRETIPNGYAHGSIYKGTAPTAESPIPAPGNTNISEPGSLVWVVGNMKPNEVRTLTYRVKLLEDYTRLQNGNNKTIQNNADAYSGNDKRDSASAPFTPSAGLNMKKSHAAAVRNPDDGSYTITYNVWIEAYSTNTFILDNVRIVDSLNHPDNPTDPKALNYITYMPGSFQLYKAKTPSGDSLPFNGADGNPPKLEYTENEKSFTFFVGDMNPGDVYCLQYKVRVGVEAFAAISREQLPVHNRAIVRSDNATKPGKQDQLEAYSDHTNIAYDHWAKKAAGNRMEQDKTISIQGDVYDATVDTPVKIQNPDQSFPVPAGSYQYTITVNDLGDWDIHEASAHDKLQSEHMKYTGYVRVDAYNPKAPTSSPEQPSETCWVKVDNLSEFQFTMGQIGFNTTTPYAYQLTYYAKPVNIEGISSIKVTNEFELRGPVGIGNNTITLTGVQTEASVIVQGGYSFEANKHPWYYQGALTNTGAWDKGTLYWVIQVDGAEFRTGVYLKDYVTKNSQMLLYDDSVVGVYKGTLPEGKTFTDYTSIDDLEQNSPLKKLSPSDYTVTCGNSQHLPGTNVRSEVIISMNETVPLGDNTSLYIVVKAAPTVLPANGRDYKTYQNSLSSSDNGSNWVERDKASQIVYGGGSILKELERTFTFDGTSIKDIQANKSGYIPLQYLKQPGHYASWTVKVNYAGTLSGRYRMLEHIPDGMEVTYARLKWLGSKTSQREIRMCQIPDYQTSLGGGWTEHTVIASTDNSSASVTSYYYTNGNQVLWEVDNLVAGHERDTYSADFQVVCRVTAPDVLQGGKQATFNNYVELQTKQGSALDSDSNGVSMKVSTMTKEAVPNGSTIPFTITVNPLGEDLAIGSDTITLVDEMSQTLRLDPTTVKVIHSKAHTEVKCNAALHENTLIITLPDNLPLTITYTADVVAAPEETVAISNHAYWQGYANSGGAGVEDKGYSYSVNATAGGDKTPTISVAKMDQYNLTHYLAGAEFELQEGTMANGTFTPTSAPPQKQTTDEKGIAKFGNAPHLLAYNTVYRITETQAPDSYVLDSTPRYVLVAKKNDDDTYPTYPEGVTVYYDSSHFVLSVPNRKGEAYVEKKFTDQAGNPVTVIDGTYRFGLYEQENPTGKPIQTIELTFREGTKPPKGTFINLELDKAYYIYELDDAGNPIRNEQSGIADSRPFIVTYASTSGDNYTIKAGSTVTVTNQLCVQDLPQTGGHGTTPYTAAGLLLLCGGAWLWYKKERHGREAH